MATQLDIIRRQAEGALRGAASRASGSLRRDSSLVNQVSRLAGHAAKAGPAASESRPEPTSSPPAPDGYQRRSPVQPLRVAPDYHRRQVMRIIAAAATVVAICVGIYLLNRLGLFER